MNPGRLELARRLFVVATEIAEAAVEGQAPANRKKDLVSLVGILEEQAQKLGAVAGTIRTIATDDINGGPG